MRQFNAALGSFFIGMLSAAASGCDDNDTGDTGSTDATADVSTTTTESRGDSSSSDGGGSSSGDRSEVRAACEAYGARYAECGAFLQDATYWEEECEDTLDFYSADRYPQVCADSYLEYFQCSSGLSCEDIVINEAGDIYLFNPCYDIINCD